jgi:thiamine biosynthesis protein ThiS
MTLHINGEPRDCADGLSLAMLVEQLGVKSDRVAVELNLEIAPRATWAATQLKDGDKLEIVHFVGGGNADSEKAAVIEPDALSREAWTCQSCRMLASKKFCSECGEKKPSRHDLSIGHLLSHAGEVVFHWDSKIFRSLRVLLTQPGRLSAEYVAGRRKRYVHPFQMFFIANLLYFLLFPWIGWSGLKTPLMVYENMFDYSTRATRIAAQRATAQGLTHSEFQHRFDHVVDVQSRSLVVVMVPFFALLLAVLEWRKLRFFGEHMVFAFHFYALWLIVFAIVIPTLLARVLGISRYYGFPVTDRIVDGWMSIGSAVLLASYLFIALRRFYGDGVVAALIKAVILTVLSYEIVQLYRIILFLTAVHTA